MHTKKQTSLIRKILHGIMLLGVFLSTFVAGNLPTVRAQDTSTEASAKYFVENPALLLIPGNDDFNTPELIGAMPYTNTQDTLDATTASDDPTFPCGSLNQGSNSVWYRFTPSEDGTLTAKTETSGYDTVLALWRGARGSLINVACNDDAPVGIQSQIITFVQAGTPYFLEVVKFKGGAAAPAKIIQSGTSTDLAVSDSTLNLFVDFNLCPGAPNNPLFTTRDNEDNARTGVGDCDMDTYLYNTSPLQPIEFNINVPDSTGITSADLLLLSYDVDENSGEVDKVYFNDHYAGTLAGVNDIWSTTTLSIDPAWVVAGNNLVRIDIDTTDINRAVNTDWGQLVINGQGGPAFIRTANLDKSTYTPGSTVHVTIEADTSLSSQNVLMEINLRNSSGQILDGTNANHKILGASNDPISVDLIIPVTGTPQGNYNIQVLVYDLASYKFQDSQVIPFVVIKNPSKTFRSVGSADGWILESTETSIKGGTLNSIATTFNLGDDAQDKQYRAILHFNTAALPDNAAIVKVTLRIRKQLLVGNNNPFLTYGGGLKVDIRKLFFGSTAGLVTTDFQAPASKLAVGTFSATPVLNWYSANILSTGYRYINKAGTTQFRLRFLKDDNDDRSADYMKFFSGNYATVNLRPTLIVEYRIP